MHSNKTLEKMECWKYFEINWYSRLKVRDPRDLMRTALCLLIDSWLWLFFFLRALTYCVLKTLRAKGNARLNTAEEQKNHFQMQMCSVGFFTHPIQQAPSHWTLDRWCHDRWKCTEYTLLQPHKHFLAAPDWKKFFISFAPEFQTWPTWQCVWKYSYILIHRKHFKWETSHVVAESVFILDRQWLV